MKNKFTASQFITLLSLLCCTPSLTAQTDTVRAVSVDARVDLVSRYIWRGQDLGTGPGIQPGLSATWKGFTLGSWGSYTLTGKGSLETDLYLSKTIGFVTVAVWDYWTFNDSIDFDYFNYKDKATSHQLEGQVLFSGGEKIPFNLMAAYFFYGSDPSRSLYLELQYLPEISAADMVIFAGYQVSGTGYAEKPSFVNVGCTVKKSVQITDRFSLPISLSLIVNPAGKSAWLVAGITL